MCYNGFVNQARSFRAPRTMLARHSVLLTLPSDGNRPLWSYHHTGTLPRLISFVSHSYENTGGVGVFFPFWFTLSGMSEGNSSPSLITPTLVLSFHALTKCKFPNSFLFIFMQIGGGGGASSLDSRIVVSSHSVNILLNEVECRVLGSLIEKEITTPEYYPLSLNALINACNQKSNRDPVMNLDEAAVRQALHSLDGQSLVRSVSASDSRVTKYEHRLQEAFNFYRHEIAILCVLLLRGPQTPGELRTRAERMHPFDDLSAVQSSLQHLMKREPPLVKVLPRQPGTKEARYAHLLSGDVESFEAKPAAESSVTTSSADGERIAHLENELEALRNEVSDFQKEISDLKQQFAQFKKQFE